MTDYPDLPPTVANGTSAEAVVRLPALGLSSTTMIVFAAGAFFAAAGAAFEYAIFAGPLQRDCPGWLFHGLFVTVVLTGLFVIFWSVVEMFRRFEFTADAEQFQRTISLGPLRWWRSWPQREIAGTILRVAQGEQAAGEDYSRLMLVFSDGRPIALLPQRHTSALVPVEAGIRRLLFSIAPPRSPDDPPLGGGLAVTDSAGVLRITAGPIAPSLVSNLYFIGGAFACVNPLMSVLIAIAVWDRIRNKPTAWVVLIGQCLTMTIGGLAVRRWIRGIAERRYEITVDPSRVTVRITSGANVTTRDIKISDVREVRSKSVVSAGEGSNKRPEIVRLELVADSGKPIELLYGRPREETQWVLDRIRARLKL
jgi:hypothetical protein